MLGLYQVDSEQPKAWNRGHILPYRASATHLNAQPSHGCCPAASKDRPDEYEAHQEFQHEFNEKTVARNKT
eukprot:2009384-Amphidinium_carterae.1